MKNFGFPSLFSDFSGPFSQYSGAGVSAKSKKRRRSRTCRIEELESREMLSAAPWITPLYGEDNSAIAWTPEIDQSQYPEFFGTNPNYSTAVPMFPLEQTFTLHSRPESMYRIYLDFNGFPTDHPDSWNDFTDQYWSLDDDRENFSDRELLEIQWIWAIVADKFSAFDVNVTTDVAMFDEPDNTLLKRDGAGDVDGWGIRVVFGADGPWGGVAYMNSFNWDRDVPCYVQNYGAWSAATVAVHEVGHTIGLGHDGRNLPNGEEEGYYGGHWVTDERTGTEVRWAPIMGVGYGSMEQWSKGEYLDANNLQDDLEIITSRFIHYLPDLPLEFIEEGGQLVARGTLESGDVDSVTFRVGSRSLHSYEAVSGVFAAERQISSLYFVLTLTNNATGEVVFEEYSRLDTYRAYWEGELDAGIYTLSIAGAGVEPTADRQGFSSYGSIGAYTIYAIMEGGLVSPINFRSTGKTYYSVSLAWDAVDGATGYELQWRPLGEEEWLNWTGNPVRGIAATIADLEEDTLYEFRVRAILEDASVEEPIVSRWSSIVLERTNIFVSVPANFHASAQTANSITLAWEGQAGLTGYAIQYKKSDATLWETWDLTPGGAAASTIIIGLDSGTEYDFRIQAFSGDLVSEWSSARSGSTLPSVPLNFQSSAQTASSVTLTWSPLAGVLNYALQYRVANTTPWMYWTEPNANATSATITGLASGTVYEFRLTATNAGGSNSMMARATTSGSSTTSSSTNPSAQTADPVKVSGAKADKKATTLSTVTLTWKNNDRNAVYQITYTASSGTKTVDVTGNRVVIEGLEAGKKYKFSIVAKNAEGQSAAATTVTAATQKYAAVKGIKTKAGLNSVELTWRASTVAETTGYIVEVYDAKGKSLISSTSVAANKLSATVTGLEATTRYTFVVRAEARALNVQSADAQKRVSTAKYASVGRVQVAAKTESTVTLNWKASMFSETTDYEVFRLDGKTEVLVDTVQHTYGAGTFSSTITDLDSSMRYTFIVRAVVKDVRGMVASKSLDAKGTVRTV